MEPGTQRVSHPERSRLADQDEKGGLEGIFGRHARRGRWPGRRCQTIASCRSTSAAKASSATSSRIGRKSFQELAVGQVPDGPDIVEGSELTKNGPVPSSD